MHLLEEENLRESGEYVLLCGGEKREALRFVLMRFVPPKSECKFTLRRVRLSSSLSVSFPLMRVFPLRSEAHP